MPRFHRERHRTKRIGWLRAAVLGANDGIVSTASLVLGVASADGTHVNILIAGGARVMTGALRVTFWGALAMALTTGVWVFFGPGL